MGEDGLPPPTAAHLRGDQLYGDDFMPEHVERWFRLNAQGYAETSGQSLQPDHYGYHELNRQSLFRHLPPSRAFRHALGFGSGYGSELAPLAARIGRLTIVEAGSGYGRDPALVMPTTVIPAQPSGDIPLEDATVDLVTSFAALMYVPNVSHVLREFARVLEPGGLLLLREQATSMDGRWGSAHRGPGVTPHARGVPPAYLRRELLADGFRVERETPVSFPLIGRLWRVGPAPYNSRLLTSIDLALCRVFSSRARYHAVTRWQKARPYAVSIVARRR